jgi:hypothetical protein
MAATIQHDAAAGSVVVMEKVSVLGDSPSRKGPSKLWRLGWIQVRVT